MNCFRPYVLFTLLLLFPATVMGDDSDGETPELTNQSCLDCHADADTVGKKYQTEAKHLAATPHTEDNGVTCVSCHTKAAKVEDISEHGKLGPATCDSCHDTAELKASIHGKGAAGKVPGCTSCHGHGHKVLPISAKGSPLSGAAANKTCDGCHAKAHKGRRGGVHFELIDKGDAKGASCVSCHSGHAVQKADIKMNPGLRVQVTSRCAACHKEEFAAYSKSIHGVKLLKDKDLNSASCLDCHYNSSTGVVSHLRKDSMTHKAHISETCASCHEDARMVAREGLNPSVVSTYNDSFHGRAIALGEEHSATCSSCHKYHDVYRINDPRSSVHPRNIKESCGTCHPGASDNFLTGKIHTKKGGARTGNYWAWVVRNIYITLIVLVIGAMILHNLLDFIRKMIIRARAQAAQPHVERMAREERIAHFLFLSSFISLAYTGFVLMYPSAWFVEPLHWLGITEHGRAWLHRGAAVVMSLLVLYHIYFILFTRLGRQQGRHFLPRLKDLTDLYHNLLWFLGRRAERPRFDRFGYIEKAEYLALVWGTALMVVTGFILWFEQISLAVMPLWLYEVFGVVHRLEAILAVLSILVWHFYYVFINPDEAPMSLTWITGKMTHHELKAAHPLDYERQVEQEPE